LKFSNINKIREAARLKAGTILVEKRHSIFFGIKLKSGKSGIKSVWFIKTWYNYYVFKSSSKELIEYIEGKINISIF
jgi:hypothetical protein